MKISLEEWNEKPGIFISIVQCRVWVFSTVRRVVQGLVLCLQNYWHLGAFVNANVSPNIKGVTCCLSTDLTHCFSFAVLLISVLYEIMHMFCDVCL